MKTVTIDIAEPLYAKFVEQARRTNRLPVEVINEALNRLADDSDPSSTAHSVLDIKSFPLGPPIRPWTTRAEMMEGFMDDRG